MIRSLLLACATLSLARCAAVPACGTPPCPVARARLVTLAGHLVIPIVLNGHLVEAALDTGAAQSVVTSETALAVDARVVRSADDNEATGALSAALPGQVNGVGGDTSASFLSLQDLELAGGKLRNANLWSVPTLRFGDKRIAGVVGDDLLQSWDLDLDVGSDRMTLEIPQRGDTVAVPWTGATTEIRWTDPSRIKIPVMLDGHRVIALLDTGAPRSLVASTSDAGVDALAGDPVTRISGVDGRRIAGHLHHFRDLSIGGHSFGAIDADVAPTRMEDDVDMLLGLDFLNAFRVYVAYDAHTLLIENDTP